MERTAVQRLAGLLRLLVWIVLAANLLCLLLVPGLVAYLVSGGRDLLISALRGELDAWIGQGSETHFPMLPILLMSWTAVWSRWDAALLTVFFWLCGSCTSLILWQAKRVLDTILAENPFQLSNACALHRAAVCCWVISGAALVRLILWLTLTGTLAPLVTYNTLFIPAFLMAGLLFQVMSALFRQAAELQEDQDLTI